MKLFLKILLPFLVLALGVSAAWWLIHTTPMPQRRPKPVKPPVVRVVKAKQSDYRYWVTAQGTVRPRTETALVPQVSGQVVKVSPSLAAGGFFEKGDLLLEIDPTDYRLALTKSEATVATAASQLSKIEAEANVAQKEWKSLGNGTKPSALVLKKPQLADAQATLASAKASLEQARLDLSRTQIRAPFAGRVRSESVDVGQYVNKGSQLASIYAVDYAEVRLPLSDEELAFVDLPLSYRGGLEKGSHPLVILTADFAGKTFTWQGTVVRTEGEIDLKTRMVVLVAQVKDPYGDADGPDAPPLASGMFVRARIQGRLAKDVFVLPRSVLMPPDKVVLVSQENRLKRRKVQVLRVEENDIVIGSGLANGDVVCTTMPKVVVEDMLVSVVGREKKAAPLGKAPHKGKKGRKAAKGEGQAR